MAFHFCDRMIHDFRCTGMVIFREILPTSLVSDLRKATVRVPQLARDKGGPRAQRLQPIDRYLDASELKAFHDLSALAPLIDAIKKVLSPRHLLNNGEVARLGLLIEPSDIPYATAWHRDIRETHNVPDVAEFRRITKDAEWFNQYNCPLYEDNCTWYVPGSHHRDVDLPGEVAAAAAIPDPPADMDIAARERTFLNYCAGMPGAIRAYLNPGDFMFYHPNAWHLGNYLPDRKRMTIHGFAPTPELLDWYARWEISRAAAAAAKK